MLNLNAKLTLSRPRGMRDENPYIEIAVMDGTSRCDAVRVKVPLATFTEALFGLASCDCTMEFNDSGVIGQQHEHKTEVVYVKTKEWNEKDRTAAAKIAIAEFEVDGWEGRVSDALNGHRHVEQKPDGYTARVTFNRYVPVVTA